MKMYLQSAGAPEIINRVEELSKKKGVSMVQVAIAWSLSQDGKWKEFIHARNSWLIISASCDRACCWHQQFEELARHHRSVFVMVHRFLLTRGLDRRCAPKANY